MVLNKVLLTYLLTYLLVKINGKEIVDLRYADDTSLLSESASGLPSLVESVKDHSKQKGLMLNVNKDQDHGYSW